MKELLRLARQRSNDAVKLAYFKEADAARLDGMDLGALAEFKRRGNGTVELKLVDRMAVLEKLVELSGGEQGGMEAFLKAVKDEDEEVLPEAKTGHRLVDEKGDAGV